MLHHGAVQSAPPLGHVGEVHQGPVCQTQGQIQIPEAHVAVHAQHPLRIQGQRGTHAGDKGCFACTALARDDGNALSGSAHGEDLLSTQIYLLTNTIHYIINFPPYKCGSYIIVDFF